MLSKTVVNKQWFTEIVPMTAEIELLNQHKNNKGKSGLLILPDLAQRLVW